MSKKSTNNCETRMIFTSGGIKEVIISNECSIEECAELNEEQIKEIAHARSKQPTIANNHTVTFIMNGKGKEK